MLVMEAGLRALGSHVGLRKRMPSWDDVLRGINEKLKPKSGVKKTERWRKNEIFIGEAAAHLRAVKFTWRNTNMHIVEKGHDDLSAEGVLRNVRLFMAHLATVIEEKAK